MKYLEEHELEIDRWYLCENYDGIYEVLKFIQGNLFQDSQGGVTDFTYIRFVIAEISELIKLFQNL